MTMIKPHPSDMAAPGASSRRLAFGETRAPEGESVSLPWYALADLPAGRVIVRVMWAARVFLAARAVHPRTARLAWCTVGVDGAVIWLPLASDRSRWGLEPDCWQPVDPMRWTWPGRAPEPLPEQVRPVMVSASRSRRWGSQAEEEAKARAREGRADRPEPLWWLSEPLTYSEPGQISRREAEGRVMRAILTDGMRRMETPSQFTAATASALSAFVAETITSAGAPDRAPFEPSPRDISDYLTAMGWFASLAGPSAAHPAAGPAGPSGARSLLGASGADPAPAPAMRRGGRPLVAGPGAVRAPEGPSKNIWTQGQKVLVWRAFGFSWRVIARRLGVSPARAHEILNGGARNRGTLDRVHELANARAARAGAG